MSREGKGKVRIIRLRKREGLIRARLIGVAASRAPIVTFLDSHVECMPGNGAMFACLTLSYFQIADSNLKARRHLVFPDIGHQNVKFTY